MTVTDAAATTGSDPLAPLHADVALLERVLAEVLGEAEGDDLYADVERLRAAAAAARHDGDHDAAARVVEALPLPRAEQVAKALTVLFHLVNLAEERHRVRTLRRRDTTDAPATPDSLAAAVAVIPRDRLADALPALEIHPVLTAHPTEARRRAVVTALGRIAEELDRQDDPRLGASERADARRRLVEEIAILWRTGLVRSGRLGPLDEVRAAMAIFDETLFRIAPALYRSAEAALGRSQPGDGQPVPAFLRLGSWIGGDRDGNPHVTAEITRETAEIQADHVLRALENACLRIGRTLTLKERLAPPSRELRAALEVDRVAHPRVLDGITRSSVAEPHRQKLLYVAARIAATRERDADLAYRDVTELLADLRLVQDSLVHAGAPRIAHGELQHLIWQAETFGFHLAELEVRQHSKVHAAAIADLLGSSSYDAATLDRLATEGWPDELHPADDMTNEVLATLRVMAVLQERWGPSACSRYVVSFSHSAVDLVAVRALARAALADRPMRLDVVPLFETSDDLRAATDILDEWIALPGTRRWLEERGHRVEVMLGYSDSAKDVGPLCATLLLYDAQVALVEWAARRGVALTLFHGRGGSLGRGGGPVNRAILAQPPGSVAGRFKVTEQGEVVFARYGNKRVALRHLEQVTSAVLLAGTPEVEERNAAAAHRFAGLARQMEEASRAAYRSLVETAGFADFFAEVSPLEELSDLSIGSRPARRSGGDEGRDLSDLRAIPWVFAWSQIRCNLPGWFGVGSALEAVGDVGLLREAYRDWPLLRVTLDNAEMSLAKADIGIAARYLALGNRDDLAKRVLDELDLSTRLVLQVLGEQRLLGGRAVLGAAVDLRNPYVDALSHLQLRALSALRAGVDDPGEEATLQELLLLTVNGVAAGLQNTG